MLNRKFSMKNVKTKKEIRFPTPDFALSRRILVYLISISVGLGLFFLAVDGDSEPTPAQTEVLKATSPQKLLFVGNSFTYYNDGVDAHLEKLIRSTHPNWHVRVASLTTPNQTVRGHVLNPDLGKLLDNQSWDIVIVQGASFEPINLTDLQEFNEYSAILAEEIRASGSDIAFFMTWAYRSRPLMIGPLASGYVAIGNELSARVVPVGLAWEEIRSDRPVAYLYSDDRHPSIHGTYLAACVFYAALYGESPLGNEYLGGLPEADARYLQQMAWLTVTRFAGVSHANQAN